VIARALFLVLALGSAPVAAQAPVPGDLPVREVELENGMRVLILPQPGAPTVATVVQFRVGGVNEVPGRTGIAHLLEHLLFKGTTTVGTTDPAAERILFARMDSIADELIGERVSARPDSDHMDRMADQIRALEDSARTLIVPNEFDRILTTAGARGLNATTDSESTTYFVELPRNRLELWFALEADRMRDPVFREFYTERDVVAEERLLRTETQPAGLLYETHLAAAYRAHPYRQPVVGWMSDIESLRRPDVERYYRDYYGARNAVVTIVGDLDPDEVEGWARRYFGPIRAGREIPPVVTVEPEQRGERRVSLHFDAEPALRIGWHVGSVHSEDTPALVMLTALLTGGRTARLHRRLILEDRSAVGITSGLGPGSAYPLLFTLQATPRAPHTTAELEAAIYEELDALADEPPDPVELERVRNQYEAGEVRRLVSNLGLALQLAESESLLRDWRSTFEYSRRVQAVTPEDVSAVVRKYFRPENRTVATLVDDPEAGR